MKKFMRFSVLSLLLLLGNIVCAQEERVVTLDFTSNDGWNFPMESTTITEETTYTKDGLTVTLSPKKARKIQWTNGQLIVEGMVSLILPKFDFEVEKIVYEAGSEQKTHGITFYANSKLFGTLSVKAGEIATIDLTSADNKECQAPNTEYMFMIRSLSFSVKSIKVYGKGGTTGIKEVKAEHAASDVYYTLSGVRVAHPQKGIYIVNGKKVVLK